MEFLNQHMQFPLTVKLSGSTLKTALLPKEMRIFTSVNISFNYTVMGL